jgi:hypothetical protein
VDSTLVDEIVPRPPRVTVPTFLPKLPVPGVRPFIPSFAANRILRTLAADVASAQLVSFEGRVLALVRTDYMLYADGGGHWRYVVTGVVVVADERGGVACQNSFQLSGGLTTATPGYADAIQDVIESRTADAVADMLARM